MTTTTFVQEAFAAIAAEIESAADIEATEDFIASVPEFTLGPPPVFNASDERRVFKPNRYGGKCRKCNVWVEAEEGKLGPKVEGKWTVEHFSCPEVPLPTTTFPLDIPTPVVAPVIEARAEFPDGTFTVVFEGGDYRTLKVDTQDDDADFMPGRRILSFLSGPDNYSNYTSFGHLDNGKVTVWKKHRDNESLVQAARVLVADPKAAASAYGISSKHCGICGRKLSTPESLALGIGPVCAEGF